MEKIFVLVPVYNVEKYLERCIDSILNQTYTNWEMVLVNDGSKDSSGVICDRYAAEHENITVIHQENGGVSVARNTAVEYALKHGDHQNDWINFVDSDDFVHPKYLEYLHRAAKEAGVDISSCSYLRTEATEIDSSLLEALEYIGISPEKYLCQKPPNANICWAKLYRLLCFEGISYPIGRIYEDDFTTHRLLFHHSEIAVIGTPLYYWYLNRQSISQSEWSPARIDKLDALEAQLTFFLENGYSNAYKSVVEALFINSTLQLRTVQAMSTQDDYVIKDLKSRQHSAAKLYAKQYGYIKTIQALFDIRIRRPIKHALKNKTLAQSIMRKSKKLIRMFIRC